MIHVALLVPFLSVSMPTQDTVANHVVEQASAKAAVAQVLPVEAEEVGFVDKYIPFMPDPLMDQTPLEPEVGESWIMFAAVSVFTGPVGAFVLPIFLPEGVQVHEDFMMEQLIGGIIRTIPYFFTYFFFIPFLAGAYLNAVGGIQTLDRNVKKARGKPPAKWAIDAPAALPGMPAVAVAAY